MEFSPFDALGLVPGIYSREEIGSAFRSWMRAVHPDKAKQRDPNAWPTPDHLKAARDYLITDCEEALRLFQHYPCTRADSFKRTKVDEEIFWECLHCGMIVDRQIVTTHLLTHGLIRCDICQADVDDLVDHRLRKHGQVLCDFCSEWLPDENYQQHLLSSHKCPLCSRCLTRGELSIHITRRHGWPCKDCAPSEDLMVHIGTKHRWGPCPICQEAVFSSCLRHHVTKQHEILACSKCEPHKETYSRHIEEEHPWDQCPYCRKALDSNKFEAHLNLRHGLRMRDCCVGSSISHLRQSHPARACSECHSWIVEEDMDRHLLIEHNWTQCKHCQALEPSDAALEEHISAHKWEKCDECHGLVVRERFSQHLRQLHAWKECPFCDRVTSMDTLRDHLRESHNETQRCRICGNWQSEAGLPFHMIEVHAYLRCSLCPATVLDSDLKSHITEAHDQPEYSDCGITVSQTLPDGHTTSEHDYHQILPCPNNEQISETNGNQAKEECPDCNRSFKNLYSHRYKMHGIRKMSTQSLKEPRIFCEGCQRDHSVSNKSRCRKRKYEDIVLQSSLTTRAGKPKFPTVATTRPE